jgi:hypothetical protein
MAHADGSGMLAVDNSKPFTGRALMLPPTRVNVICVLEDDGVNDIDAMPKLLSA